MTYQFHERSCFALLAARVAYTHLPDEPLQLSDGTWVLPQVPVTDDQGAWAKWLGSIRWSRVREANLVLLAEQPAKYPEILGADHLHLSADLGRLFCLLHLSPAIESPAGVRAGLLTGSSVNRIPEVLAVKEMPEFYRSEGSQQVPMTRDLLERSLAHRTGHAEMRAAEAGFDRVLRGLGTLMKGKKEESGGDRLHQFVRSLEALVLPKQGKSRKQFGHRCQAFGLGGITKPTLLQAYDMRSAIEHLHRWDEPVKRDASDERETLCWQRTRQIEQLACDAYSRLLSNSELREHFRTDDAIRQFWKKLSDGQRSELWGPAVGIEEQLAPRAE